MIIWNTELATTYREAAEKFAREFWDVPREISDWEPCWDSTFNFKVINGMATYKVERTDRGFAIRRLSVA